MTASPQRLATFTVPAGFRGRHAWFVQLWWIVEALLFRPSPQVFYGWRRMLLRAFGARLGRDVKIRPSATVTYPWKLSVGDYSWIGDHVTLYTLGEIVIEDNVVISQHAYLCTGSHDHTRPAFDIYALTIRVASGAWLATNVFVGPGVTVGRGAVVGACSVTFRDVPENMVCIGNPLKIVRPRTMQEDMHWDAEERALALSR